MSGETRSLDIAEVQKRIEMITAELNRLEGGRVPTPDHIEDMKKKQNGADKHYDYLKKKRERGEVFTPEEEANYTWFESHEGEMEVNRSYIASCENARQALDAKKQALRMQRAEWEKNLDAEKDYRKEIEALVTKISECQALHKEIEALTNQLGIDRIAQTARIRELISGDNFKDVLNGLVPTDGVVLDTKRLEQIKRRLEEQVIAMVDEINIRNGMLEGDMVKKDVETYQKTKKTVDAYNEYRDLDDKYKELEELEEKEKEIEEREEKLKKLEEQLLLLELHDYIKKLIGLLNIAETDRNDEQKARIQNLFDLIAATRDKLNKLLEQKIDLPDDLNDISKLNEFNDKIAEKIEKDDKGTLKTSEQIMKDYCGDDSKEKFEKDTKRLGNRCDEIRSKYKLFDKDGHPIEVSTVKESVGKQRDEAEAVFRATSIYQEYEKQKGKSGFEEKNFIIPYETVMMQLEGKYQLAGYTLDEVRRLLTETKRGQVKDQTIIAPAYMEAHVKFAKEKLGIVLGNERTQNQTPAPKPQGELQQPNQQHTLPQQSQQPQQPQQSQQPQGTLTPPTAQTNRIPVRPFSTPTPIVPIQPIQPLGFSLPEDTGVRRMKVDGTSVTVLKEEVVPSGTDVAEKIKNDTTHQTRVDETKMYRHVVQGDKLCYVEEDIAPMLKNPEEALRKELMGVKGKLEEICAREGKKISDIVGLNKKSGFAQIALAKKRFFTKKPTKEVTTFIERFGKEPSECLQIALALRSATTSEQIKTILNSPFNSYELTFGTGTYPIIASGAPDGSVRVVSTPKLIEERQRALGMTPMQRASISKDTDLIQLLPPFRRKEVTKRKETLSPAKKAKDRDKKKGGKKETPEVGK